MLELCLAISAIGGDVLGEKTCEAVIGALIPLLYLTLSAITEDSLGKALAQQWPSTSKEKVSCLAVRSMKPLKPRRDIKYLEPLLKGKLFTQVNKHAICLDHL